MTTNLFHFAKSTAARLVRHEAIQDAFLVSIMVILFLHSPLLNSRDYYYSAVDILQSFPLTKVELPVTIKNGILGDTITQMQPWLMYTRDSLSAGRIPLWNPYNANGMPFLANYQSAVFSPYSWLFYIFSFRFALVLSAFLKLFFIGFFTILFLKELHLKRLACWVGATAFTFCGYNVVWLNYLNTGTIACLPASLFFIERSFRIFKKEGELTTLWPVVGLTISLCVGLLAGHPETFFFCLLLIVLYTTYRLITMFARARSKHADIRPILAFAGKLVIGGLLAAGVSAVQLVPFFEYLTQSQAINRGLGAGQAALRTDLLPLMVFPNLFGVGTSDYQPINSSAMIASNYSEANSIYIGGLVLIFALLSLFFIRRDKRILFFVVTLGIWILYAYSPLGIGTLFGKLPILSFAYVNRSVVIGLFCVSCCTAFGIHHWLTCESRPPLRYALYTILIGILFLGISIVGAIGLVLHFKNALDVTQFMNYVPAHIIVMSLTILIGIVSIALLGETKHRVGTWGLSGLLLAAIFWEGGGLLSNYNPITNDAFFFPTTRSIQTLQQIVGEREVLFVGENRIPPDTNMAYHISTVAQYDALDVSYSGRLSLAIFGLSVTNLSVKTLPLQALALYGIDYVLISDPDMQVPAQFEQVASVAAGARLYKYTDSLTPYYTIAHAEYAKSDEEAFKIVTSPSFDARKAVIIKDDNPALNTSSSTSSSNSDIAIAQVVSQQPEAIRLNATCTTQCYLVISKTYYPGWKAIVNGTERPILRANYAFSAIRLDPGKSHIDFIYDPLSVKYGALITTFSLIIGIGFICLDRMLYKRNQPNLDEHDMVQFHLPALRQKIVQHSNMRWTIAFLILAFLFLFQFGITSSLFKPRISDLVDRAVHEQNWITEKAQRFAEVKALLPRNSIVGYTFREAEGAINSSLGIYQTQYTLAPIRVHFLGVGPTPDWVIGEFNVPVDLNRLCTTQRLVVIKDFGNGIVLFRRAEITK